jgi:hypothetical protein
VGPFIVWVKKKGIKTQEFVLIPQFFTIKVYIRKIKSVIFLIIQIKIIHEEMFQSNSWSHREIFKHVLHILGFKKIHNIMKQFDKVNRREIIINNS